VAPAVVRTVVKAGRCSGQNGSAFVARETSTDAIRTRVIVLPYLNEIQIWPKYFVIWQQIV
jgi:hypothetical protein